MSQSHPYYESPEKLLAREENVKIYRKLTGLHAIPADRHYVTLAAMQRDTSTSEINQMLALGIIGKKRQFVGVDLVEESILHNRTVHPEAIWLHQDITRINFRREYQPALIYIDTECVAGRVALNICAGVMVKCPVETVILLNVMQTHHYQKAMEQDEFLMELAQRVPNLKAWEPEGGVITYEYVSNKLVMRTMVFHLRGGRDAKEDR